MAQTVQTTTSPNTPPSANGNGKQVAPIDLVRDGLVKMRSQISALLPAHIKPEQFERVVLLAVTQDSELLRADRKSLFTACLRAASDGLVPDKREGALVMFGPKVTWMPMVFGLIKKARQSGEVAMLAAHVVYEKDEFEYVLGTEERIMHKPAIDGDPGKPRFAYAVVKFKDGTTQIEGLTASDIAKIKKVSRSGAGGPWHGPFETEMWRKSAIRRLSKYLPLSAEDRRVFDRDDEMTDFGRQREEARNATLSSAASQLGAIEGPRPDIDGVIDQAVSDIEQDVAFAETTDDAPSEETFPGDR